VRLFQRALQRGGIGIVHSGRFNPRPRISAVLPRTVGVESEDDLLVFQLYADRMFRHGQATAYDESSDEVLQKALSDQVPQGCEIVSLSLREGKISPQPRAATVVFQLEDEYLDDRLRRHCRELVDAEELLVVRNRPSKKTRTKDIRGFLESVELSGRQVSVRCLIKTEGTVRVNELQEMLGLETEKLREPIKRMDVEFE